MKGIQHPGGTFSPLALPNLHLLLRVSKAKVARHISLTHVDSGTVLTYLSFGEKSVD